MAFPVLHIVLKDWFICLNCKYGCLFMNSYRSSHFLISEGFEGIVTIVERCVMEVRCPWNVIAILSMCRTPLR